MNNLREESILQGGKYKIIRFISSGGFGCTYEAEHTMLHKRIAIKEFFVKDFCNRDGDTQNVIIATEGKKELIEKLKKKFFDEAVAISSFNHPNIVRVHDVFKEHDTIYYVMDYLEGGALEDIVNKEGKIPETEASKYILEVCDALSYVHERNRLHLDIKPGNLMLDSEGNVILIDFGASKQYDEVNGENTSSIMGKTPGYAPLEQIGNSVKSFAPCTDIYSLGATFYKLLTGKTPPEATVILDEGFSENELLEAGVSRKLVDVIAKSMSSIKRNRYQTVGEFVCALTDNIEKESSNDNENTILIEDSNFISKHDYYEVKPSEAMSEKLTIQVNGVSFNMICVEGGNFFYGSN